MSKIIIRIEHPEDGVGIFCHRFLGKNLQDRAMHLPSVISTFSYNPRELGQIYQKHQEMESASIEFDEFDYNFFCAYPSVEAMKKWINCHEIKDLLTLGFKVLLLDVEKYHESDTQVIFTKESITSSKDISSLFI